MDTNSVVVYLYTYFTHTSTTRLPTMLMDSNSSFALA